MKETFWSLSCVYPKGYIIEQEGSLCQRIGLITKGTIQLVHYNEAGDAAYLATLKAGDTFGDILMFSDDPIYPGHLMATTETHVKFMDRQTTETAIKHDHAFCQTFIKNLSNKANTFNFLNKLYQQPTLEKKIYYYLEYQMLTHDKDYVVIESISDWASVLGVQRPSLSRTLSGLIKDNKLKKHHKQFRFGNKA